MILTELKLGGAFVVEPTRFQDERGFFVQEWSVKVYAARGLDARFVEANVSYNRREGTLRGMHYQAAPHGQAKLVRCTRGRLFDVIIDLRPESPTFRHWAGVELSAHNGLMLFIPAGFAHGYQTLEDDTEVFYLASAFYTPESGRGVRWNDPAFGIEWPSVAERVIIARDCEYPDFES